MWEIEEVDVWAVLCLLDELLWSMDKSRRRIVPDGFEEDVDIDFGIMLLDELIEEANILVKHIESGSMERV